MTTTPVRLRFACAVLLLILAAGCVQEASHPSLIKSTLNEIIPARELIESEKSDIDFKLSPDGNRLAWISFDGSRNVARTRRVDQVASEKIPLPSRRFKWAGDSRHLLIWPDVAGGESGNIFVADAENPSEPPRQLTHLTPPAAASVVANSQTNSGRIFVQHNGRDPSCFDLYSIDIITGAETLVAANNGNITRWLVDDDKLQAYIEHRGEDRRLMRLEQVEGKGLSPPRELLNWSITDNFVPIDFGPARKFVWVATDLHEDKISLRKLDLATGRLAIVFADENVDIDIEANLPFVSATTRQALFAATEPAYPALYPLELKMRTLMQRWTSAGPARIKLLSMNDAETAATVNVFDGKGSRHFLVNLVSGKADLLAEDYGARLPGRVATGRPIRFKSRDGLQMHGYLTLPAGVPAGFKLPVVVRVHGGPWYRNTWGNTDLPAASTQVRFLANRGYAVLEINFRGSTGYGRKFMASGEREFGRKMQDDITDGVRWSIAEGIADPDKVAIMGTSYGGYSALMGITASPNIFACGIAIAAPVNLATMIEAFPKSWALDMHYWHRFAGNPANPQERAAMLDVSPINHVEEMTKPLLLVHGRADPLVNVRQSEELADALRARGHAVTLMTFRDEGHSIVDVKAQAEVYRQMENFLAGCLGGRTERFTFPFSLPRG